MKALYEIGILGDGKPATEFKEAATALKVKVTQLSGTGLTKPKECDKFFTSVEKIVFANSEVDFGRVSELNHQYPDANFFPPLQAIRILSDRILQKAMLLSFGITVLPEQVVKKGTRLLEDASGIFQKYPKHFIKWSRHGTAGHRSLDMTKLTLVDELQVRKFITTAWESGAQVYAEEAKPNVERFVAACVRWPDGKIEMSGQNNAIHPQLKTLVNSLELVGVVGAECFQSGKEVWVNDIFPAVIPFSESEIGNLAKTQYLEHLKAILKA